MGDKVQNLDFCLLLCHFADSVPDSPLQQLSKEKAECTSGATETNQPTQMFTISFKTLLSEKSIQ